MKTKRGRPRRLPLEKSYPVKLRTIQADALEQLGRRTGLSRADILRVSTQVFLERYWNSPQEVVLLYQAQAEKFAEIEQIELPAQRSAAFLKHLSSKPASEKAAPKVEAAAHQVVRNSIKEVAVARESGKK